MAAEAGTGIRPLGDADPRAVGTYRLTGRLGSGGMGSVFAGLDQFDRRVAIKIVHAQFSDDREFRARFTREVALLRRVRGTCTTPVLDADVDAPQPWFACEYVPGPTLAERVDRNGPMSGDELFALAAGLAEALVALHGVGIVHRDLKPQNVVCSPAGPRVLDLGIARSMEDSGLTRTGMMIGSPAWMSPERFRGHNSTPAADVYAWAMMVAYASTGVIPFGTGAPEVVAMRVLAEEADISGVPHPLRGIVERAADKDPLCRPSAHELLGQVTSAWRGALGAAQAPALDPVSDATSLIHLHWKDPAAGGGATADPGAADAHTVAAPRPAFGGVPGGVPGTPHGHGGPPGYGEAPANPYAPGPQAVPPYASAAETQTLPPVSVPPPPYGGGPAAGPAPDAYAAPGTYGTEAYHQAGPAAPHWPGHDPNDQADTVVGGIPPVSEPYGSAPPPPGPGRRRAERAAEPPRRDGRVGKPLMAVVAAVAVIAVAVVVVLATRGGDGTKDDPVAQPPSTAPDTPPKGTVQGPGVYDLRHIKLDIPAGWEARPMDDTSVCITPLELSAEERADCLRGGLRVWAGADLDRKTVFENVNGWTLGTPATSCPGEAGTGGKPTGKTTGRTFSKVGELTYEYALYTVKCADGRKIEPQVWWLPMSKISFSTAALPRTYDPVVQKIMSTADRSAYRSS
ncbi:serine/threonine protein kinase [Yinghuangia sp. ASG 101]|uniref:serine/threonine-protein kinase n=1 Tax=Yinghuangia sp. ASG 101 TaxID=2896848 RepID=UPI001E610FE4|nr:serine/threonine-protein kinase [Yinghuangia sp. ASG 101]UGQ14951.1 serine/threonine protein kinase [Yinghuangia sp. ASG 101]